MSLDDPALTQPPLDPGHEPVDQTGRAGRAWYRRSAFIAMLGGVLVVRGNFWLGLIAIVLLAGDRTRDLAVRIGGSVLIVAWMFTWTLPGVSPYVGFTLFSIAAYYLLSSARSRHRGEVAHGWRAPLALGAASVVLAVVGLVPYGVRSRGWDEDAAARRARAARAAGDDRRVARGDVLVYGAGAFQDDFDPVDAQHRLVEPARFRFTNAPIYYVVLFEENDETRRTGDGEPCFVASETLTVHGVSGEVVNLGRYDAVEEDGFCLPLLRGTRDHIEPIEVG